MFEPEAFAVHLQDVDMMSEPVEERTGEAFGAEDAGPFIERQIGRDDGRPALVALGEDLEEQFGAGWRQGDVAQFIDDQEPVFCQLLLQAQETLLVVGFEQLVDQSGCGDESDGQALLAGGQSEPQGDVCLAGSRVAHGDDVLIARRCSRTAPIPEPASC